MCCGTMKLFSSIPRIWKWAHIAPFQWFLLPHGMAAGFALFLGPLQFSERLRRKYLTVHKVIGYLYTTGCYLGRRWASIFSGS